MFDHLLSFADEGAARSVLPDYWLGDLWRSDRCIPGLSVYAVTGTETVTDPESGEQHEIEIRQPYPGWFINIALPELDPELRDLPDNSCRLIVDRAAASEGKSFVLYTAPDLDPQALAAAHVEPTFAGSAYPFGAGP